MGFIAIVAIFLEWLIYLIYIDELFFDIRYISWASLNDMQELTWHCRGFYIQIEAYPYIRIYFTDRPVSRRSVSSVPNDIHWNNVMGFMS